MPAESPSHRQRVLLLGASGRMGFAAFQELWARRDASGARRFDVSLLVRPSRRNKAMFAPFERERGVRPIEGAGLCADQADSFRIVWGDALNDADLAAAMRGADWVLCPMAFISPQADHDHRQSKAVNVTAIGRRNPFFAQVWHPNHDPAEHGFYPDDDAVAMEAGAREVCA